MQEKIKRLARLVRFLMKLKRLALLSHDIRPSSAANNTGLGQEESVPRDVKEGYFGVLAGYGEEMKRFVVGIHHLKNPEFVRLLDKAAEEYGFRNDGLVVVPCLADELHKILEDGI